MNHKAWQVASANPDTFAGKFMEFLRDNLHVYDAFEKQALAIAAKGFKHYSSRTIIEVLRHHSALQQVGGAWKLNDHITPYMARLFMLLHPELGNFFEFRTLKSVK
jgi:hypothetical protein